MKKIITPIFCVLALLSQAQTTQTFNYTGSVQTFTVPSCVTSVTIDVQGAAGGPNGNTAGGAGGRVQGILPVTSGDVLNIYVGGAGFNSYNSATGGYNGGGGVYSYSGSCGTSGTGGGASDIRLNGVNLTDRVVVAGGGGGAGGYVAGNQTYAGGNGGTLISFDGAIWPGWPNSGGKGGNQSTGGAQGTACCSCPTYTTNGGLGVGGTGSGDCAGGGGGGAGYYGGGGSCFAGAGGGSNYAIGTMTGVSHTAGFQTGNGVVTITYTVGVPPVVSLGNDVTQCGGTVLLDAQNAGSTYSWSTGATSQTINVTSTGTYSVVVTSPNGCTGTDVINVTINTPPTVSLGNDVTQCEGTVLLDAQNAGSTYSWSTGATSQTITVSSSGVYTVVVTDVNGCTASSSVSITINANPSVVYNETQNLVCINWSPITLTAGTPSNGTYSGPAVSGNMFDPATAGAGTHAVIYTFTDVNGCTSSDTSMITVDLCTGINSNPVATFDLQVYPNPTGGQFTIIIGGSAKQSQLKITNALGEIVYNQQVNAQQANIDIASQGKGVYFIQVTNSNGVANKKIMIK